MERVRGIGLALALCAMCLAGAWLPEAAAVGAVRPSEPNWAAPHVAGELLVRLPEASAAAAQEAISQTGAAVLRTIPALGLAVVQVSPGADLRAAAIALQGHAGVLWAEPNYTFALDLIPDDPYYATHQASYLGRLGLPAAWDLTIGRPDIVIAILDTGVTLGHPDLASGIWVNPGEIPGNGLDDDGNGFVDDVNGWDFAANDNVPDDDHGHGTHVAGIAAARINNGIGIAGMAGGVTIMPVDVFGGGIGTYEDLIRAIIYATDNGAHVINMSLGASSYSRGEEMAVDYAVARGVVVVAAAGNTGRETYHYPAAHPNVIAVAATTASDALASFSTRGDFVDVAAPGVSIISTYRGGGYAYLSGTSMATPHVAGLAALILSRNPTLTPAEVRQRIESTATDLGAPGWDREFGAGRINADLALLATEFSAVPPADRPGPPLGTWPAGCQEVIPDGGFEDGLGGWQASGAVTVDNTRAYFGSYAAHFAGGENASGTLTRTLSLPVNASEGTLWFAYRIENRDYGWGTLPSWPFDDWLVAEFRTADGQVIDQLLRTGNSADSASSGLPWDRYLYRMQPADVQALLDAGSVNLVFTSQNDNDLLPTDFWVDAVRFCVARMAPVEYPYRYYIPHWANEGEKTDEMRAGR